MSSMLKKSGVKCPETSSVEVMESRRETFASIVASLSNESSRSGLQGIWQVVVTFPEEGNGVPEHYRAVYGPDGQYLEADMSLGQLGFGTWHVRRTGENFEVEYQKPLLDGSECVGVMNVHLTGRVNSGASYSGTAKRSTFDMSGVPLAIITTKVHAERLDPATVL
jgi:hypothetical protein